MRQKSDGGVIGFAGFLESQNVTFPEAVARLQTLAAGRNRERV